MHQAASARAEGYPDSPTHSLERHEASSEREHKGNVATNPKNVATLDAIVETP